MATFNTDTYDPRNVIVTVNGTEIVGFAEGSMVEGEKREDRYSAHVGAKGEVTFGRSADDTGVVKITLKHNSPSNGFLMDVYKEQDEPDTFVTVAVQDRNFDGEVGLSGSQAKIVKAPNFVRGAEVEDTEWEFLVADYEAAFSV